MGESMEFLSVEIITRTRESQIPPLKDSKDVSLSYITPLLVFLTTLLIIISRWISQFQDIFLYVIIHVDLACSVVWLVRSLLPHKWHLSLQVMRSVCYTHITTLTLSANSEDELPLFTENNKFICFRQTQKYFYVWLKQINLLMDNG